MKKLFFLFIGLFLGISVNAQKKMIAKSQYRYNLSQTVLNIDSSSYTYNTWIGSLDSYEFSFSQLSMVLYNISLPLDNLSCNKEDRYSGASQPLSLDETINYTLSGWNVTKTEGNTLRDIYGYDIFDNNVLRTTEIFNGTSWNPVSKVIYKYDNDGNRTVHNYYDYPGGIQTFVQTDTFSYVAGTSNVSRIASYSISSGQSNFDGHFINTWNGNELQNSKYYSGIADPQNHVYNFDYTYSNNQPILLEAYLVNAGQVEPTPSETISYTYGSNGKIQEYTHTINGQVNSMLTMEYDSDGFMSKLNQINRDPVTSALYLSESFNYYYVSTASLEEAKQLQLVVFPNPTQDKLTIQSEGVIHSVQVFTQTGKLLLTQNSGQLDVSHLASGTYHIVANTSNGTAETSFIKE